MNAGPASAGMSDVTKIQPTFSFCLKNSLLVDHLQRPHTLALYIIYTFPSCQQPFCAKMPPSANLPFHHDSPLPTASTRGLLFQTLQSLSPRSLSLSPRSRKRTSPRAFNFSSQRDRNNSNNKALQMLCLLACIIVALTLFHGSLQNSWTSNLKNHDLQERRQHSATQNTYLNDGDISYGDDDAPLSILSDSLTSSSRQQAQDDDYANSPLSKTAYREQRFESYETTQKKLHNMKTVAEQTKRLVKQTRYL